MTAYPRYAVATVDDRVRLLKWAPSREEYGAIASAPPSSRLELSAIADDLNKLAETEAREEAEAEARETQLDAMVIHHEADRHPELHADARPDSYGYTGPADRTRRIGFLPPDGTVPGR
ncbi:hypothetical protein SEA_BOLT007_60 [Arthrobacter phage Bolt007]|uniref:Uncharacterized protein n=1 Tax=Arthrobacter phage Bolt007 TaxID=3017297 RepID=A0AA49E5H9_9CAUD|nr:hypothetical protein SEA_BOLT007_60 [Arthrobacter phage Bolt007]